ncbi:MAG TPA: hypothetical protein ENN76_02560, partial [Euryarchaeota archaeon]|nr:hypothetical protein [Euryarchaeota archaeon]
ENVFKLVEEGIKVHVQKSWIRIHSDEEFEQAGATVTEDLSEATVIFGVKEMPVTFFEKGKTYVFFSHTIKGQTINMPMLRRMKELGCTLIDYERIVDENGRRLIFFGRHAGIGGMAETIWALGKRLDSMGQITPFSSVGRPYEYKTVKEIKEAMKTLGTKLEVQGVPKELSPMVVAFTGYGNVSIGAQEIFDHIPHVQLTPQELLTRANSLDHDKVYKVVFYEKDMVKKRDGGEFELKEYFEKPDLYEGIFYQYLPHISVLINCIYWDERYPRLITKQYAKEHYSKDRVRPFAIGDISCDVGGSVEFNMKATDPSNPVYMYNPETGKTRDGYNGDGVLVMAVDALPAELPWDSSEEFSKMLKKYIPAISNADYNNKFEDLNLPEEVKRAIILYRGEFTDSYRYMKKFISD